MSKKTDTDQSAPTPVFNEPWCNVRELAKHTGLSVTTLKRLTVREEIPSTIVHGRVLFKISRVDAALDALDKAHKKPKSRKKRSTDDENEADE